MQWRGGLLVAVMLLAGCSGSEEGTANTAPIRAETTTVAVATDAPVTTGVVTVVTTEVVMSSAAAEPTPVGDDYRVPVVVKFVPTTDAEREVLNAATDLLVKYRMFELREVSDRTQLSRTLIDGALDEFAEIASTLSGDVNEPSLSDRVVIESIESGSNSAKVIVCQVDGARVYVKSPTGEYVMNNALMETVHKSYELRQTGNGWRIAIDEVIAVSEGADECAGS